MVEVVWGRWGLYSAINNCTTVKQVLDNAATWQQMVKNNLIVYCIEQSDDFMKTLVDYPDRLYELVSNEYMQTLMKRSSRYKNYTVSSNYRYGQVSNSLSISGNLFLFSIVSSNSYYAETSKLIIEYNDGSSESYSDKNHTNGQIYKYLTTKKIIKQLDITATRYTESQYTQDASYTISVYDLTKLTI